MSCGNDNDRNGVAPISAADHSGPHCSHTHTSGAGYTENCRYSRSRPADRLT
jgi:hypothetical protein